MTSTIARREFIAALGGTAVAPMLRPLAAHAQQSERVRRIGVLMGGTETTDQTYVATLLAKLEELGWKSGRNVRTDVRWWKSGPEQMRPVISDLLASSPDVIVAYTNLAVAMLKPMAANVPIVFVAVGDPIGSGFISSLARQLDIHAAHPAALVFQPLHQVMADEATGARYQYTSVNDFQISPPSRWQNTAARAMSIGAACRQNQAGHAWDSYGSNEGRPAAAAAASVFSAASCSRPARSSAFASSPGK